MLVGDLGEEALLRELRALFGSNVAGVPIGIGDDAAVLDQAKGRQWVWSADMLLEGVHFDRRWQTAFQLGRKCLAVNLSDIAAMAATPGFALLSIACADDTPLDYIIEFCQGFASMAAEHGVAIVGGDTTGSKDIMVVSVSIAGTIENGKAIRRSGASAGDAILVTGHLGDAAAGLCVLQAGGDAGGYPGLIEAFIAPEPRLAVGRAALEAGATAMTDISDGLASDLRHICEESGTGAMVDPAALPVSGEAAAAASRHGWDLEQLVLTGGEDYELLFTLPGDIAEQLKQMVALSAGVPVTIIGEIMPAGYGLELVGKDGSGRSMPVHGYDHFLRD